MSVYVLFFSIPELKGQPLIPIKVIGPCLFLVKFYCSVAYIQESSYMNQVYSLMSWRFGGGRCLFLCFVFVRLFCPSMGLKLTTQDQALLPLPTEPARYPSLLSFYKINTSMQPAPETKSSILSMP